MTRRQLLAAACFSLPLVGVAVACTFPSVSYDPGTVGPGGPDTGPDRSTATGDANASTDAPTVIVMDPGDATPVDLTKCFDCDCDRDGWWRDAGCDAGGLDAKARAGFGDCDDSLAAYHPNQPNNFYASLPRGATQGFDFDCSGHEEPGIPAPLPCGPGQFGVLVSGCTPPGDGFRAVIGCGQTGELVNCSAVTSGLNTSCALVSKPNQAMPTPQVCH